MDKHEQYAKELMEAYNLNLAGSRYFAEKDNGFLKQCYPLSPNTDWDLFAEYDENLLEALLMGEGFDVVYDQERYPKLEKSDTKAILKSEGFNVEITLRENAFLYKKAIEMMPLPTYLVNGWKSSPWKPSREVIKTTFDAFINKAADSLEEEKNKQNNIQDKPVRWDAHFLRIDDVIADF